MSRVRASFVFMLLACCCSRVRSSAARPSASADGPSWFECGRKGGPCGHSIPAGVICEQGPGWCQPGYYCGAITRQDPTLQCLPVPANCGTGGNPCCPSNKDSPHTSTTDPQSRLPFCTDGSVCFYDPMDLHGTRTFGGVAGTRAGCVDVPGDCGLGEGSTCCPSKDLPTPVATNPPVTRTHCPSNMFCKLGDAKAKPFPGSSKLPFALGICYPNKPDCGSFGKTCCIKAYSYFPYTCGVEPGKSPQGQTRVRGYCERDPREPESPYVMCKACPAQVQQSDRGKNPNMFNSCGTGR